VEVLGSSVITLGINTVEANTTNWTGISTVTAPTAYNFNNGYNNNVDSNFWRSYIYWGGTNGSGAAQWAHGVPDAATRMIICPVTFEGNVGEGYIDLGATTTVSVDNTNVIIANAPPNRGFKFAAFLLLNPIPW
jgi:hypothetical protein